MQDFGLGGTPIGLPWDSHGHLQMGPEGSWDSHGSLGMGVGRDPDSHGREMARPSCSYRSMLT
jgi:hypothetical protein